MTSECLLKGDFKYNPLPDLEYTKTGCDIKKLLQIEPKYKSKTYFNPKVNFIEPPNNSIKNVIFKAYPETISDITDRSISIMEEMNNRLNFESEKGTKSVCYLIVTHGGFVDLHAYILEIQREFM